MSAFENDAATLVQEAIVQLNTTLPEEGRISTEDGASLAGSNGALDSLGLIDLIVLIEDLAQRKNELAISLVGADDVAMLAHFSNIRSLTQYVEQLLAAARWKSSTDHE